MILENRTASSSHDRTSPVVQHSSPAISTLLNIGTLNCRGLRKSANPTISSQFIRYLRSLSFDLLALQETYASSSKLQNLFHTQFQAVDSVWSPHCGLVSFSPNFKLSDTVFSVCGRLITTTVRHSQNLVAPFKVSVLYAPAARRSRYKFLQDLISSPLPDLLPTSPLRHILLGDFNHTLVSSPLSTSSRPQAPSAWLDYIRTCFIDGITPPGVTASPTFHRGFHQSCIDYLLVSHDLVSSKTVGEVRYIQPTWTDHLLLSLRFQWSSQTHPNNVTAVGKGLWRAHPNLALDVSFCKRLSTVLTSTVESLDPQLPVTHK